jgi:hypothetical protein
VFTTDALIYTRPGFDSTFLQSKFLRFLTGGLNVFQKLWQNKKNYSEISYISREISQKFEQGKFELICVKSDINIG